MRVVIVVVLAIVALGAAGVWALGEYGHLFAGGQTEARAPMVREPELVAANDAAPAAAAPNSEPALSSAPPTPPAEEQPAALAEPATDAPAPAAAPPSAERFETAPTLRSAGPPAPAEPPPPPPPAPAPAEDPVVSPAQASPAPAATVSAAGVTPSVAEQFKMRKLTYNRPPEKLALDKPIDISLIIDSTGKNQAAEALKDLPGTIVEREVGLSDFVAAELKGADFDIELQTAAVRQKLSPNIANEWRWRVTPTAVGKRTLTLTVYGYATGSLDAEPLDSYRDEIVVEVQQLDQIINWAKGVQPVFAVLAALAGAASALFAFLRFREEKKNRKAGA